MDGKRMGHDGFSDDDVERKVWFVAKRFRRGRLRMDGLIE
jgi:hypothetical protein